MRQAVESELESNRAHFKEQEKSKQKIREEKPNEVDLKTKGNEFAKMTQRTKSIEIISIKYSADKNDYETVKPEKSSSFKVVTPKAFKSNSHITAKHLDNNDPKNELTENIPEESRRTSQSNLNPSKLIFTRDVKSKSNNLKSSRSSNLKIGPLPPTTGIKKFLQGSLRPSPNHRTSLGKSFDEIPANRQPVFGGVTESKTLPTELKGSFKKLSKDMVFLKNSKNSNQGQINNFSGNGDKPEFN